MILGPHPSLLIVFVNYHYRIHGMLFRMGLHLLAIYTLTFMAFSSLIIVLARDPGPVGDSSRVEENSEGGEEDFLEALLAPPEGEEAHGPGKWCRKCMAPKPERAHHCGTCGRCVLKMGKFQSVLGEATPCRRSADRPRRSPLYVAGSQVHSKQPTRHPDQFRVLS